MKGFLENMLLAPWGGVLPIMVYTGRLRPKGVPFAGFYERVGLLTSIEVYKSVGKSVITVCDKI